MSKSTEEYLEAVYNLSQGEKTVTPSALSKRLNIAPPSTTEMLKRLADEGYVNYSPYQGVTLTENGLRVGEKITRKHRLIERFLNDKLGIEKDKVHSEACAMEHALSDESEQALCQALKVPYKCPDDEQLIPPCDLAFSSCQECKESRNKINFEALPKRKESVVALSTLKERQAGTIAFIRGEQRVLRRLCDMGLTPGTRISVSRVAPFKGPLQVMVKGCKLALGDEIASNVFVNKPGAISNI